MDEEPLSLEEQLKILRHERHERKASVLARARAALATAREDMERGVDVDPAVVADLERSIAEYERYTIERPGLPPDA